MQLCWSLDKVGPICRSADDCGLVLAAIYGADPRDAASVDRKYVWPSSRDISTIRVGYNADAKNEDDDAKRENLQLIRELGAKLLPVQVPTLSEDYKLTNELVEGVVRVESGTTFEHLTRRGEPKGVQGWPSYWIHGHLISGVDYLKLNRMRSILMQRFDKMMQTIDIYVGNELRLYDNLTGHPKIVLPRKFEEDDGLLVPRPLFLMGRIYDESTLLALADVSQRALGFAHRPRLDQFLAEKDDILKDEEFPDENKLYLD